MWRGAGLLVRMWSQNFILIGLSSKCTLELVHSADVVPDIFGGSSITKSNQFLPYYFAGYTHDSPESFGFREISSREIR